MSELLPMPRAGDELPVVQVTPTTRQLVRYAGATDDYYEAHYDLEYARSIGLPGVITHGLLKLALLARAATEWAGPDCFVRELSAEYRAMDLVNQPFRAGGSVVDVTRENGLAVVSLRLAGISADGTVSTTGFATIDIPTARGRAADPPSTARHQP
jgi:acyl dehydratase